MDEYRVKGIAWRIFAASWVLFGLVALCWVTFSVGWGTYLGYYADLPDDDWLLARHAAAAVAILSFPFTLGALVFAQWARTWVADDGLRTRRFRRVRFMAWQEIAEIVIDRHRYGNDGPYHNLYIQVRLRNGRRRKLPALYTEPRIHAVHADMVARWNAADGADVGTGTGTGAPGHPEPRMVQLTK
ncbi:hypothetical protein [Streptomyces roseoverticillatus]|uniref:Uncharacterized protein n=1 Tax=Streptomyces roseoverticillatus TaxID=66429 RepID=A0ABV3J3A8_9ACTN